MGLHDQETISLTLTATSLAPGAPTSVLREASVPRQLGAVKLVREIGRGGMGVVWLGQDEMLGREVAVKFLLGATTTADDPNFATFLEGARAAAKLRLQGITAIYHADVTDGAPYIVMEYVDGPTLAQISAGTGPLHQAAALWVMKSVCDTLAGLHDSGIIHRDIKPSNVMLDMDCRVYLTDFGVALLRPESFASEASMTRANVAGTPAYMAPEMFEGYASPRSDTYQLGMMFYELLCGTVAFDGSSLDSIREKQRTLDPDISKLVDRKVDRALIDIVERSLRKDPKFRYKSARHFLEALDRANLPASVRIRGESELRAAALKLRTGGVPGITGSGPVTPGAQRNLYDHMATIAATKRANPQSPPVRVNDDSALYGLDSDSQPQRLLKGGVVPEKPGGKFDPTQLPEKKDDAPLSVNAVMWIGAAVFAILLVAIAGVWIASRFNR
jgi:serine/threonine protein kinase